MNTLTINVDVFKNFLVQAGQTLFRAKKHSNMLHTLAGRRQGDTADESGDQDGNLHCGSKSSCERKKLFCGVYPSRLADLGAVCRMGVWCPFLCNPFSRLN